VIDLPFETRGGDFFRRACRLALVALLVVPALSLAQPYPQWRNLTNGDGVSGIGGFQGRIWVTTNGGLVSIDKASGSRTFYTRANSGLTSNGLSFVHTTATGHVWIGMASNQNGFGGGIARFNSTGEPFYPLEFPALPFSPAIPLSDNRGDLWMCSPWLSPPRQLAIRQGETWSVITSDSAAEGSVTGIVVDHRGDLWVSVYPWQLHGYRFGGGLVRRSGGSWTTLTPENSELPSYFLTALASDQDGALWIGHRTDFYLDPNRIGGISRFDGSTWTHFDRHNSGLASESIYALVIDRDGVKWVGTSNGLFRFDGNDWTHFNTGNSGLSSNVIRRLYLDAEDDLWIGTLNAGLVKFDREAWTSYDTSNSPLPQTSGWQAVTALERDPSNRMWIGLSGGRNSVKFIRASGEDWTLFQGENAYDPANNFVYDLAIGKDGKIWVATNFGLGVHDGDDWTLYDSSNSPLGEGVGSVVVDSLGIVWASAIPGVASFDGSTWTQYTSENSGLPTGVIAALAIDYHGDLLVSGGYFNSFLVRFDGQSWTSLPTPWGTIPRPLIADNSGNLWAGALNQQLGLARFDGNAWTIYDTSNSGIPSDYVESLAVSGSDVWIGTCGGGVAHFDGERWESFNVMNSGIGDDYCIPSIEVDAAGAVWIGQQQGGISIYSPVTTAVEVEAFEASSSSGGVLLTWRFSGSALRDLQSVGVERADIDTGGFELIATLADPATMQFLDTSALNGTYWYRLSIEERSGQQNWTSAIRVSAGSGAAIPTLEVRSVVEAGNTIIIRYRIPRTSNVDLSLYDVRGRKVQGLVHGARAAGDHSIAWTASAPDMGRGLYFLHLDAGSTRLTRKLVFLKP